MNNQNFNSAAEAAFEEIPMVELTGEDGKVFKFRYGAMIPYTGEEYAVLLEMELDENGEEQVLITRVQKAGEDSLSFEVVQEDDIIQAVFEKYVQLGVQAGIDGLVDEE